MIQVSEYLNSKTIFDSTSLAGYDYFDSDICDALNNIFGIKYNKMYLIDDNETNIHEIVADTILLNNSKYTDIFNAMQLDPTKEFYESKTNTGTQTYAQTGTVTNVSTPEVVTTVNASKNTANNGTLRVIDQTESSSTGDDTVERTDNLQNERTDNLTEIRQGYNDIFTSTDKLLNFANMDLYDNIITDIMKAVCFPIYNINDLAF